MLPCNPLPKRSAKTNLLKPLPSAAFEEMKMTIIIKFVIKLKGVLNG